MAGNENDGNGGAGYFICPNCGSDVRAGAVSCPVCGSDERTGWKEDAGGSGLPAGYGGGEDFDYEAYLRREFGGQGGESRRRMPKLPVKTTAVIILLAAFVWLYVL